jgi:hypothetical protein
MRVTCSNLSQLDHNLASQKPKTIYRKCSPTICAQPFSHSQNEDASFSRGDALNASTMLMFKEKETTTILMDDTVGIKRKMKRIIHELEGYAFCGHMQRFKELVC